MTVTPDLATLVADDFEGHLNETFQIRVPGGELSTTLKEVRRLGRAIRAGGAFALLFVAPPGPFLKQAIYPVVHPTIGTLELFLVPIGPEPDGNAYEAIFT